MRRPGDRDFISMGRSRVSKKDLVGQMPAPKQRKMDFRKGKDRISTPLLETGTTTGKTKKEGSDAEREFSKEEVTQRRRKRSTEELGAMQDHELLATINSEEKELKNLEMQLEQREANIRRMYNSLTEEGREAFWKETYDLFAEKGYKEYMERSGHNKAIRKTLPVSLEYINFPCLFLAAGDAEIASFVLQLKDMPKDLGILLNQYKLIQESNPRCPFLDAELAKKIRGTIELNFPPAQDRIYFNELAEYKVMINDISDKMLAIARENLKAYKNVFYGNFSATRLPEELEGRFMTVMVSQFLHLPSMKDKMNIIKSIYRALKPGGVAVIVEEEEFKISKGLSIDKISLRLRAVACPIKNKSELVSMFTRFEDRDGTLIGFEFMEIGAKWPVDKQPKHVMRSYLFRKPLKANHFVDAAVGIFDAQVQEKERGAAHNAQHMLRTAVAAADYVDRNFERYGIERKNQIAAVAAITGLLHDFVRNPGGTGGRGNGVITADLLKYVSGLDVEENGDYRAARLRLAEKYPEELRVITGFIKEYREHIPMMAHAIRVNEGSIKNIGDAVAAAKGAGRAAEALLIDALLYADKAIEGMGPSAILRMAQSASGERAEDPQDIGGIKEHAIADFQLNDELDETEFRLLAYLGESMIRSYADKPTGEFPSDMMWGRALGNREVEVKVHKAILQYLKNTFGLDDERQFFDILIHLEFPNFKRLKDKIGQGIGQAVDMEVDGLFADDAAKLVIGLAYSQSKEERLRELGSSMLIGIRNRELRQIAMDSDIDQLKAQFASYFD